MYEEVFLHCTLSEVYLRDVSFKFKVHHHSSYQNKVHFSSEKKRKYTGRIILKS